MNAGMWRVCQRLREERRRCGVIGESVACGAYESHPCGKNSLSPWTRLAVLAIWVAITLAAARDPPAPTRCLTDTVA